jgi:hypothetical protein
VQATSDQVPAHQSPSRSFGDLLVPVGVAITLLGVLGDLVVHAVAPHEHANESLIVLGSGNNPWHLVLFLGIVVTAVGGIRWAGRLHTEWGALAAAALMLLLGATAVTGGWVGWQERGEAAGRTAPGGSLAADHDHGAGTAAAPTAPAVAGEGVEGASEFGSHSHGEPGPTTAAEAKVLKVQLAEARAASRKYRDVDAAKADGYIQVTQFIPGLGLHMANLRISQRTFDPGHPQVLLYEPTAAGGLRLAGVAYTLQAEGETPPEGFAGGGDVWHFHRNLCFLLDGTVTVAPSASACQARSGIFQARTAWLLHVWLWKTNPDGLFTEINPQVF